MKLDLNEDNIELFKMTLWLNLVIGLYVGMDNPSPLEKYETV